MAGISEFIKQPVEGDTSFSQSNKPHQTHQTHQTPAAGNNLFSAPTFLSGGDVTRSSSNIPDIRDQTSDPHHPLRTQLRLTAAQVSFSNISLYELRLKSSLYIL